MIGVKLNTFNDNPGEPEQDANSALTELDKGLRSSKVGEQCEAIVRFPRLFEKYPFPILINSSFLKLADVFRMGNNFLRLWVLRVCQQSEKHLDKILNVDEFLRRIYSVLHSNDPVARALSLQTLGAVAGIIPERQNVHHAIRRGLDSHDNVEVDAAIYATTRFAAHSNAFAVAMCNKLSEMVECENTSAERRVKLIKALRTVHGGAVRAQAVLKLLKSLLERFPSSSSVRAAISALTAIADDTVVHVPDQVELLLNLAMNDPRSSIRRSALLGLKKLASHAALWPADCIQNLVRASDSQDTEYTMLCLEVMAILMECPAVMTSSGASAVRRYCSTAALSADMRQAATAALVLTRSVLHCYEEGLPVESSELMMSLESVVIATALPNGQDNIKPLKTVLKCLVQLSTAEPSVYAKRTAQVVGKQLECSEGGARELALLEALGALGGSPHCPQTILPALPALKAKLAEKHKNADKEDRNNEGASLILLCTVIFQERAGTALSCKISSSWEDSILQAVKSADGWTRYRIAIAALRYCHYNLAAKILKRLTEEAPSESAQRWLSVLHKAAVADASLLDEGLSGVEAASAAWELCGGWGGTGSATGSGGCASGCGGCGACTPLSAAHHLARARSLAALARAAAAARVLCTQPPPAVAQAHAQAARDPAAGAGAAAVALRKAARALHAAAAMYRDIARTAFHADDATLRLLHISQSTYSQLAQFIERITHPHQERTEPAPAAIIPRTLEERIALYPSERLREISEKLQQTPPTAAHNALTHRHAEAVLSAVRGCVRGAVWARGVVSSVAGGAACRVALTPAPRPAHEHAATLPLAHHLALKLDGVVLHTKQKNQRQVKGVQLTFTATPHPRTNEKTVELANIPPVVTAVQTVTPLRDFFSAQQLISVGASGLYTVAVEAAFIDEKQQLWNTGPRTSIVIKAHEDPNAKGTAQAGRGRF